jgi:hypothetical protein
MIAALDDRRTAQLGIARAGGLAPANPQRRHGHEHFDPVK